MNSTDKAMLSRVRQVRDVLDVDVCSLYLAHPDSQELEIVATCGLDEKALGARLKYSQGLTGKVARTGQPVAARHIQDHPEYFYVADSGEEAFHSYLGIPLSQADLLMGVLVIQTRTPKTFFHKEIRELHAAGRDLLGHLPSPCTAV